MFPKEFSITIHVAGTKRVAFVNGGGDIVNSPENLNQSMADVVMNCIREGYWADVTEALVVCWDRRQGSDMVYRVIEINKAVSEDPIEYMLCPVHESDCAFMLGSNHSTGVPLFVGDFLGESPFVSTFKDSKICWFNELEGIDKIIQRGYIGSVMDLFHGMLHHPIQRDLHIVWAKVKA